MENNTTNKPSWLKTAKDILNLEIKEIPTLAYPIIPKQGVMSLAGSSDLGKSLLLLQFANAIINDEKDFLGFPLNATYKKAIYLSSEDDEFGMAPRLLNLSRGKEDIGQYDNLRIVFETKNLLTRLDRLLGDQCVDLVVIDTFSDVFDGDMNQANRVRGFLNPFKDLARKYNTCIIFNHHCGKKNDIKPPHKDNLLGSQGFESCMRLVLELRKDFSNLNRRHLCVVKGNNIKEEFKNSSFVLDFSFDGGFVNTGERVPFDKLVKSERSDEAKSESKTRMYALKDEGLSYSQIAEKLNEEGYQISRSTIGNVLKDYRPSSVNANDEKMDGQSDLKQNALLPLISGNEVEEQIPLQCQMLNGIAGEPESHNEHEVELHPSIQQAIENELDGQSDEHEVELHPSIQQAIENELDGQSDEHEVELHPSIQQAIENELDGQADEQFDSTLRIISEEDLNETDETASHPSVQLCMPDGMGEQAA